MKNCFLYSTYYLKILNILRNRGNNYSYNFFYYYLEFKYKILNKISGIVEF